MFEIVIGQGVVLQDRSLIGGQVEKSGTLTVGQENAVRHITFVSKGMDCVFLFLLWNKKWKSCSHPAVTGIFHKRSFATHADRLAGPSRRLFIHATQQGYIPRDSTNCDRIAVKTERGIEAMVASVHGIDFSGNEVMWRPGCGRSNVWIATAELRADLLELVALRRVQDLPGTSHPFDRLVAFLAGDNYLAAAIDAPFALPFRHMPVGGFPVLLRDVARFETGCHPFAKGEVLVEYGKAIASLEKPKPMRKTEQVWSAKGINIRSTLWNGPRGGAPFTVASLTLLYKAGRPVWPWGCSGPGLLVESFPAGQLHQWNLPYQGYAKPDSRATRSTILEAIAPRIQIPDPLYSDCQENADALDSVLCLFAAIAAADNMAPIEDPAAAEHEGWIAVHPG